MRELEKIIAEGRAEEYLTAENFNKLGISYNSEAKIKLIVATGNPEKYLTEEKLKELGLLWNQSAILEIIKIVRKSRRIP